MISFCDTVIDKQKQEVLEHGAPEFPIACYYDDLQQQSIPWHWHEELEVGIVNSGGIVICTPNRRYKLMQGECFFINSGILHRIQSQDAKECYVDSLVFHARLIGGNVDSIFWRKYIRPVISNSGIAVFCYNQEDHEKQIQTITSSWLECANGNYGFEINVRYLLSQLFLSMNEEKTEVSKAEAQQMFQYNERVKQMLTYIRENFHENITVQMIADSVSISESECMRCFRNVLEISPIAYVKTYRLQHAAELISSTQWKISYIAHQCGFSDMSYFSKAFKQTYHRTPVEYRKIK